MKRTETHECIDFARWLARQHVLFCHVPNGGLRPGHGARTMQAMGVRAGVPDYLIFEPGPWGPGIAVEMKALQGGRLRPPQRRWLDALGGRGWCCIVAYGVDDARQQLAGIGFPAKCQDRT